MIMMQTKTAINVSRGMRNNFIWPTFPFKSNTMQHVFLIRISHYFSHHYKNGRKPYCIREQITGIVMVSNGDWSCSSYTL